ncbi:hypothetical protein TTHERM_00933290 (macronuclear) [Tetrahymena thermophila SB210]|uniref:Uncharacterized protein n=1 Tax=Tetrahymena thermophila (strain SB210) TaxID=312017 RepID=I7LWF9_TETTS|nr:hypothetical protein TTHERM_00933290 [Tetrahymena thermophila SB210]EAS01640.1 hypothetical protein TTHERM_00933290 [Tetrahymena thermophila SB210]|eukprot:XP_001021885.1 hypothetical protein TTHERM_00933290 [Tetrahymena thermophila SB210]
MNFQERFKGKTSQISKDLVASITDTNDRMKVDFNNMQRCDVFDISRSYTPSVKSEIAVPIRKPQSQFSVTDNGVFSKKSVSQKLITHRDQLYTPTNERQQQSIFSALQNNFDKSETVSDTFSPINARRQIVDKNMEKSKFQESPNIFKVNNFKLGATDNNLQNSPAKLDHQSFQQSSASQILQARLAKERSQSNNFQRVGSYLAKGLKQQTEPSNTQDNGIEIIILRNNAPQITVKQIDKEDGEKIISKLNQMDQNILKNKLNKSSMNNQRQKNIEKNLISTNKSVMQQMSEHGYGFNQDTSNGFSNENELNLQRIPSNLMMEQQNSTKQEEYFPLDTFASEFQSGKSPNHNSMTPMNRKAQSHINLNEIKNYNPQATKVSLQQDLQQFINGLGKSKTSVSNSSLQSFQNIYNNKNEKNYNIQQLLMNNQLSQIIPNDVMQDQIYQIKMKKEEEDSLFQYKNSFNYRQKSYIKQNTGNDSPVYNGQGGVDSPSVQNKRQIENQQQLEEEFQNSVYFGSNQLYQNTNQSNNNTPINQQSSLRQKSFSSQAYPLTISRVLTNIK